MGLKQQELLACYANRKSHSGLVSRFGLKTTATVSLLRSHLGLDTTCNEFEVGGKIGVVGSQFFFAGCDVAQGPSSPGLRKVEFGVSEWFTKRPLSVS